MKLNNMNRLLTILVPAIAMAASQTASADMSPTCAALAANMFGSRKLAAMAPGLATGASFIFSGLIASKDIAGDNIALSGLQLVSQGGVISTGLGTSSAGGFSALLASNYSAIDSDDQIDFMRQYRGTQDYRCITAELGGARTEEFMGNLFSGWSIDSLARQYLSAAEYNQFVAISTSVPSANCSEETMSCGG